ncbi:MAG: HD domain-containing protein [Chitinispirillaceae bacterium]
MNRTQLQKVYDWFDLYTRGFCTGNERIDSAICLKIAHTKSVQKETVQLTDSLELNDQECYVAQACALLHDIGRFEQYSRYQTYSDAKSENHALLGIRAIDRYNVLADFTPDEKNLILSVVLHHNRASVPQSRDRQFLFHLKLLRDADKLDIMRIMTDCYQGVKTCDAVHIGLPESPEVSDKMIKDLLKKRICRTEDMKTFNDFKLFQIGWVFDLNFSWSFLQVKKRKYIDTIAAVLPRIEPVKWALTSAYEYLDKMCGAERSLK